MGTRADFYVGRGEQAEWLGSIAWDGYPDGFKRPDGTPTILESETEGIWRERVRAMLVSRDDATQPEQGWPWPWRDSGGTDYAYAFEGGKVWASQFGSAWFDPTQTEVAIFPDMTARQKVDLGKRSGLMTFGTPKGGAE